MLQTKERQKTLIAFAMYLNALQAANRMVSGSNENGEVSEYVYNGLGKRVKAVQTIINPDTAYQSNPNSGGSARIDPIELWSQQNSPTAQKAWLNDIGSPRQTEMPTIEKYYTIDYTSSRNRDILIETVGGHTQRDVYGLERISSFLTQTEGTQDNIETDIAKEDTEKIFYHQDRMGSTAYVSKANAKSFGYTTYDEWGHITSVKNKGSNFAGTDNINDFTGHGYDSVLEKHFAQYRMYDSTLKRFISKDPMQDGTNWYAYAGNDPTNNTDPLGLATLANDQNTRANYVNATELLQRRLYHLGWWEKYIRDTGNQIATPGKGGVGYGYFGDATEKVVNFYKDNRYSGAIQNNTTATKGKVGATTWEYLGLKLEHLKPDSDSVWTNLKSVKALYEYLFDISKQYPYKTEIKTDPNADGILTTFQTPRSYFLAFFAGIMMNVSDTNFKGFAEKVQAKLMTYKNVTKVDIHLEYPYDDSISVGYASDLLEVISNRLNAGTVGDMANRVKEAYTDEDYVFFIGYSGGGVAASMVAERLDSSLYVHGIIKIGSPQMNAPSTDWKNRTISLYRRGDAVHALSVDPLSLISALAYEIDSYFHRPKCQEITGLTGDGGGGVFGKHTSYFTEENVSTTVDAVVQEIVRRSI